MNWHQTRDLTAQFLRMCCIQVDILAMMDICCSGEWIRHVPHFWVWLSF